MNTITKSFFKLMHLNGHKTLQKAIPFVKHGLEGKKQIIEERYSNATIKAWYKGFDPVTVSIKPLCTERKIIIVKP